ncbi:MAG: hemolysin family protein [Gallionellaceae bacterium]|jgi:putative hemolysin|nr:hemolysin family protein [Gallionellaceae bacterium]
MEILVLIVLIALNGIFVMSEFALITARRSRLASLAEEGDRAAEAAMKLGAEPNRFLSTIQLGVTSIGILSGIFGEKTLAEPFAVWLTKLGLDQHLSDVGATVLVVATITYFSIVLGELVPKRLGQTNSENMARWASRPLMVLSIISSPFVRLLSFSTDTVLRLIGKGNLSSGEVTEEDIHAMLEEGSEAGVIEKQERDMVRNVFRLDDRQIGSLMIPRSDIVFLDIDNPIEDNLELVAESDHSRFPVCRGGLHEILGVVSSKQLFNQMRKNGKTDLTAHMQPCVYVPETLTGMGLLEQFRASNTQMVFVVDEYGEIQGLVTMQDVLEAVTGEFKPPNAEEAWAVQREDGSWLLDGLIPIPELKDCLGLKEAPEEDKGRYHTLSGMIMWLLGHLPRTGEATTWDGWRLEVVDLDGKRVDKILASRLPDTAESSAKSGPVESLDS